MKSIANIIHQNKFPLTIRSVDGRITYYENATRYWFKSIFNSKGKQVFFANSTGLLRDTRHIMDYSK